MSTTASTLAISAAFDAGAIEVVSLADPANVELRIRKDSAADFAQWFHFRLQGTCSLRIVLRFLNAGECAYPKGWAGYQVLASTDRQHWFRIPTTFDGSVMTATVTPETNSIDFAYFEPYSYERHLDLIGWAGASPRVGVQHLGHTLQGRDMTLLRVAMPSNAPGVAVNDSGSAAQTRPKKINIWLIARQHPGETMAEWFAQGFLERLLDEADPVANTLLQRCVFHVVPHINPDGAVLGNLRTNAAGANLNREWQAPTLARSPEVFWVREAMQRIGVDLCLDAHGDEALPYNFVAGAEGNPGYSPRLAALQTTITTAWCAASPDFQTEQGYGTASPNSANPTLATNWISQNFDCLALTIEMPFKDNANLPNAQTGWSGERSKKLGASALNAVLAVAPQLR